MHVSYCGTVHWIRKWLLSAVLPAKYKSGKLGVSQEPGRDGGMELQSKMKGEEIKITRKSIWIQGVTTTAAQYWWVKKHTSSRERQATEQQIEGITPVKTPERTCQPILVTVQDQSFTQFTQSQAKVHVCCSSVF